MSSNEVDRYDVEAMIRDERYKISGAIADTVAELRLEMRAELEQVREELAAERVERQNALEELRGHVR